MKNIKQNFKTIIINNKNVLIILAIIVLLGTISYFTYDYYSTKNELSEYKDDSELTALKERADLLEKIKKVVSVPEDEEPTIATVTNAFRLRGQTFFARSENGDKVVIYPKSGRAILYRPSIDKIIEAAPVNITDIQGSVAGSSDKKIINETVNESTQSQDQSENQSQNYQNNEKDPEEPAKIAIYNGTITIQGIAGNLANYLKENFPESKLEVTELSNADELFDETIIINNTKKYNNLTEELAKLVSAKETMLPDSEDIPQDVDILIILGKDIESTELNIL